MVRKSKSRQLPLSSRFLELTWISYSLLNWRSVCSLNDRVSSHAILTTEPSIVGIFRALSLISFKHVSFRHLFLKPRRTAYHLYTSVFVWDLSTSHLTSIMPSIGFPMWDKTRLWLVWPIVFIVVPQYLSRILLGEVITWHLVLHDKLSQDHSN